MVKEGDRLRTPRAAELKCAGDLQKVGVTPSWAASSGFPKKTPEKPSQGRASPPPEEHRDRRQGESVKARANGAMISGFARRGSIAIGKPKAEALAFWFQRYGT